MLNLKRELQGGHGSHDIRCPGCQSLDIIITDMMFFGSCLCRDCGAVFYIKSAAVEKIIKEEGLL